MVYKRHKSCVVFPDIVDFQFTAVATKFAFSYNRFCGKTHDILNEKLNPCTLPLFQLLCCYK